MNKEDLQQNNAGLQAILAAVKSLPAAKSWGGGAPIIEPSSEDILIPAFTNVDLTVKGVDLSRFGMVSGSFTPAENAKDISLSFDLPYAPTIVLVWHEEPAPFKYTNTILRRAVFFNHPNTEADGNGSIIRHLARAETGYEAGAPGLHEGYLYSPTTYEKTEFKVTMNLIYSEGGSRPVSLQKGYTYKWIALCA